MSATEPCDLSAVEARRLIGAKKLSPVELMESCLLRIEAVNPAVNALVTLDAEGAMAAARAAEAALTTGEKLRPLHGMPVAIKDNRDVAGMRTTHGSLLFKDFIAPADEPGTALLRAAGAIPFAKSNLPEFGAGGNTINRVFGPTRNPFDLDKTTGGSSGGAAAALATGMTPLATGSDYGGSLRTPAAFCGVAGFRPSLGVAPSPGAAAVLSPFGVNGPMGRTLADAHLLLSAQVAYDPRDPFSHPGVVEIAKPIPPADLAGLRLAVSPDLDCAPVDAGIRAQFDQRTNGLTALTGAVEAAHPNMGDVHQVFEVTRGVSFAASFQDLLATHRDDLDRNVVDNTERGLRYSLGDVARAQAGQTQIYRRWTAFFEQYDALICPAAAVPPFPHSQLFVEAINGEAMPTYMRWLSICYAPTMGFACAAAIPCGRDASGLPFGLQILGPHGGDRKILSIALALEAAFAKTQETARPVPDLTTFSRP
ncbi:MAG: amidase [Rhodobacteraceae bacterium]|nr:amidase [Paracoccaceae bacterium]